MQMRQLLVISNKRYNTDFRKYLMRAAERAGARAMHVYCWENIVISRGGGEYRIYGHDIPSDIVRSEIELHFGGEPFIALTGLGCNENGVAIQLQETLPGGVFAYDVYDDLLYDSTGLGRVERMLVDCIWRTRCDGQILLNKALADRYPGARHLDNASHMRVVTPAPGARGRMVYIGSIDSRVDFDWLRAVASTGREIDIFGRVHLGSAEVRAQLEAVGREFGNVVYRGEYDNDDLWSILRNYSIGLLPYKVDDVMTKFINPDKMYHYLNSGLEVIAAPLPAVIPYAKYVNLATRDTDWPARLRAAMTHRRAASWSGAQFTWDTRWRELLAIAEDFQPQIEE